MIYMPAMTSINCVTNSQILFRVRKKLRISNVCNKYRLNELKINKTAKQRTGMFIRSSEPAEAIFFRILLICCNVKEYSMILELSDIIDYFLTF